MRRPPLRTVSSSPFVMLAVVGGLAVASAAAEIEQDWRRQPGAAIPRLEQPPIIDGLVDRAEWAAATLIGPLRFHSGLADDRRRDIYVAYDDEQLYVGFVIERPRETPAPALPEQTGHVNRWGPEDFIEVLLDVGRTYEGGYGFVLFANGAFGEGRMRPQMDRTWRAPWRQAARLTDEGWQGELAIPFSSLGLDGPPAPGEVWGFDFVDNQRTPSREVHVWGYRQNWRDFGQYGRIRFGGETPAVRFVRAEHEGAQQAAVEFAVVNPTGTAAAVDAKVRLLRRRDGTGDLSYYAFIESGKELDAAEAADFEMTTTLTGLIEDALQLYDPVAETDGTVRLSVPAGERRNLMLRQTADPGEFLALYRFADAATGAMLAEGATPFRIETPLALALEPYWLNAEQVVVTADLRQIEVTEPVRAVFTLYDADGETVRVRAEARVEPGDLTVRASLSSAGLPPGFYQTEVVLATAAGNKRLAANREPLRKPETPPWHGNTYGNRLEVSRPWTPVESTDDGVVHVWGRAYDLGAVWPRRIVSQDREVLAAPMRLEVVADGEPVAWSVAAIVREEDRPGRVTYRVALAADAARIEGTVSVEFDGFVWYDLELIPTRMPWPVERARFEIEIAGELAEMISGDRLAGRATPHERGFSAYHWIGNEDAGLAWIAEGPIDWRLQAPDRALTTAPPGPDRAPAVLHVNLIDHEVLLDRPMRLQFGLQASPIRPLPESAFMTHLAQSGGPVTDPESYAILAERGGYAWNFHSSWRGRDGRFGWGGWPAHPRDPARREQLRTAVLTAHEHGIKATVYTGWGVKAAAEEFDFYGHELVRKPLTSHGFGTYLHSAGLEGSYADYMAWAIAQLIETYDIDGVFWDSASNIDTARKECENLLIGNGWVDHEGRVHRTVPVRAFRDLFRRVYNLFHGELKAEGVVYNFGGSVWAINAFADVFHRGEGRPMHAQRLTEAWQPLEYYRSSYSGRPFGLLYLAMNKNFRNLPMSVNKHQAVTLLHDLQHCKADGGFRAELRHRLYGDRDRPFPQIWQLRRWLPVDDQMRAYPYFQHQQIAVPEDPALLASVFVSGDRRRAALVVSNVHTQEFTAAPIRIDWEALGLVGSGPLRIEEVILGEPVDWDGERLHLDIQPERYRLLKIWRE